MAWIVLTDFQESFLLVVSKSVGHAFKLGHLSLIPIFLYEKSSNPGDL